MKQFVVTKEEAVQECQKMIVDINKTVNEELLKTTGCASSQFWTLIGTPIHNVR